VSSKSDLNCSFDESYPVPSSSFTMRSRISRLLTHILVLWLYTARVVQALEAKDILGQITFEQLLQAGEIDLPSEENTSRDSSASWSLDPVCTKRLRQLSSEICVYTNISFSNGRGISIFTTPQVATSFNLSLLSCQNILHKHRDDINASSGTWYTKGIPGKGRGMLAKHDLKRGDLITVHSPILLAYKETILSKPERERFLRLAMDQLPPPTRQAYLDLATMRHDPTILAQDIVSANSFEMVVKDNPHLAIIPEPARINHDCAPNAIFQINSSTLTHTVRATRPIGMDEEITIAYINPLEPFAKRQRYLSSSFGFKCTCSRCLRGKAADAALAEITALEESLSQWADPISGASIKQAERLIEIHQEEGLEGYLDPAHCLAALMYNSVGSLRGVEKYVKLCVEGIELRLGPWAEDLSAWREMMDDPRRHWSWMRRKRG